MSTGLARFPFVRDLDGFDFAAQPSIDKTQIRELTAGRFIANAEAVRYGAPGSARRIWQCDRTPRRSWPAITCCSFQADLVAQLAKAHSEAGSRIASLTWQNRSC